MSDVGIALLVIALIVVAIVVLAVLIRIFGIYRLASCFASSEEKAVLTKNEQYNGYMVGSESSEFGAERGGKYVEYDSMQTDTKYVDIESRSPPREESARSSPVSMGTGSLASDAEFSHGIRRAESCDSVASDSSVLEMQPDMPKIGQVEFALEYDREVSELVVSIIQARDLTANQYTGTLDTYIRGIMLPDSDSKFQTKVQRNTTDPIYKERFLFNFEPEVLEDKTLQFQLFAIDKYQRHKVIGESELRIGDVDLRNPIKMWLNLRDIDDKPTEFGDIMFSLSYLPTAERLTIVIVKARNLRWSDTKDTGDPFVKVYLLQNGKKVNKKKTTVKRGEQSPIFNEAMIFSVPASTLPKVQLRITVAELLPDNRTPSLGHVIVGANTSGTELSHWNQMMTSLRKPVAMWHYLRKEVSELVVSIIQARDLTANQYTGTLDTYIRGIMLPDSDSKFQTKVQRNTTDPIYKERFLFNFEPEVLEDKTLQFQLFAIDKYQRHKVIGESELRIGDVDLRNPIKMWLNLRDIDDKPTEFGDIMFSLSYLPTAERLTIVIVKARNLRWSDTKDTGDPFVKVYLLQNGKKVNKKKTTVKRGEQSPIFNEAMIFSVPASTLPKVQLRITVAELLPDNRTPSLGHVIVGANTSGTELSHWNQMMTSLRKPVAMWHYLRK